MVEDQNNKLNKEKVPIEDLKKILEEGLYVNDIDNYNSVIFASKYRNLEIIKYLVDKGYDVSAKNNFLLEWASKNGHDDVVEYLSKLTTSK